MSLPPETRAELDSLISRLIDGTLTPEGEQELSQILADDAEARRIYFDCISVHAMLSWKLKPGEFQPPMVLTPINPWPRRLAIAGAFAVIAAAIWYFRR